MSNSGTLVHTTIIFKCVVVKAADYKQRLCSDQGYLHFSIVVLQKGLSKQDLLPYPVCISESYDSSTE